MSSEDRSGLHATVEVAADGGHAGKKGLARTHLSEAVLLKGSSRSAFLKRGAKIDPKKIIIKAG